MRDNRRIAGFIMVVLVAAAAMSLVRATQVQPVTLPELVKRSTSIVHGTVLEARSQWEEGGGEIYTYITVSTREFLKGGRPGGKTVTFRQLGGQVGDQVIYVPGTPEFRAKQEVLLFLTGDDRAGYPQVMGIFQGAFHPVPGPGGEWRVGGFLPGAEATLLPDPPPGQGRTPDSPVRGSFPGFMQRIRDLVKTQAGGAGR